MPACGAALRVPRATLKDPALELREPTAAEKDPALTLGEPRATQKDPTLALGEPGAAEKDPAVALREPPAAEKDLALALRVPSAALREPRATQKDPTPALGEPGAAGIEPTLALGCCAWVFLPWRSNRPGHDLSRHVILKQSFRAPAAPESLSLCVAKEKVTQEKGHPTWRLPGIGPPLLRCLNSGIHAVALCWRKGVDLLSTPAARPVVPDSPPHRGPG